MMGLLVAVFLVMFISAMCSLFEAVLYSLPISTIDVMEKSGKSSGKIFKGLRTDVQRPISAILTLNTIANTAGASIAGAIAAKTFGSNYIVWFSIGLTLGILFFSEIIPKTVGVMYSKIVASAVAWPIQFVVWVFKPFIVVIDFITKIITPSKKENQISAQEIISLASIGRKEGVIKFMEEKVIENMLKLKEKKAKDIMTPRTVVFSLNSELTLDEAKNQAGVWPHSRVPVYKKDPEDIIGFVIRRDVYKFICEEKTDLKISDIVRPVHFVPEYATADRLLVDFLEKRKHLFIVIDEYGGLAGIVTLEDVLEEIIGREIVDELDKDVDMAEVARKRRNAVLGQKQDAKNQR